MVQRKGEKKSLSIRLFFKIQLTVWTLIFDYDTQDINNCPVNKWILIKPNEKGMVEATINCTTDVIFSLFVL